MSNDAQLLPVFRKNYFFDPEYDADPDSYLKQLWVPPPGFFGDPYHGVDKFACHARPAELPPVVDERYLKVGDDYHRLPRIRSECGSSPACQFCGAQFNCLAGQEMSMTYADLIQPG